MKRTAIFVTIASIAFATTALAQDRDTVETNLVAHAQAAKTATTAALDAINAGDTSGSCTAMRTAVAEIIVAQQLAAQDKPLLDGDTRIDAQARLEQQGQLAELTASLAASHTRLDALIAERC